MQPSAEYLASRKIRFEPYFPGYSGFVYLALVIDLSSRAIVGWKPLPLWTRRSSNIACGWRCGGGSTPAGRTAGLIHHSDYAEVTLSRGIRCWPVLARLLRIFGLKLQVCVASFRRIYFSARTVRSWLQQQWNGSAGLSQQRCVQLVTRNQRLVSIRRPSRR